MTRNEGQSLEIFSIPNSEVIVDINEILREEKPLEDFMMNNIIGIELKCDTISGSILRVERKFVRENEYECSTLVNYFQSFEYIKCATYPSGKKVEEYLIILYLRPNKLEFSVRL